jgi:hypothetical protein
VVRAGHSGVKNEGLVVTLLKSIARRPVPAFGTFMVVTVLVLLTLVPYKFTRTIGYEISFDGVNKELADDVGRICDMLFALGLENADVDVLGCDTTCSLLIVDLKSEDEVELVIAAFYQVDHDNLSTNVIPVRTSKTGTLLDKANETLLNKELDID